MPQWKDTSSYSRGEKDRTPNSWSLKVGIFDLIVHHHIYYEPSQWLASCSPYVFDNRELKSKDIKKAKAEALKLLKGLLNEAIEELSEVTD